MGRKFISKKTVKSYQNNLSDLIDSLGREIKIFVGSGVLVAEYDPYNNEPIDPNAEITYDDDVYVVDALIEWVAPEDYTYLAAGRLPAGEVKITCRLEDVLASGVDINNDTYFEIARKVIIDGQTVKPSSKSIKSGLLENYIVECWLNRVDQE